MHARGCGPCGGGEGNSQILYGFAWILNGFARDLHMLIWTRWRTPGQYKCFNYFLFNILAWNKGSEKREKKYTKSRSLRCMEKTTCLKQQWWKKIPTISGSRRKQGFKKYKCRKKKKNLYKDRVADPDPFGFRTFAYIDLNLFTQNIPKTLFF